MSHLGLFFFLKSEHQSYLEERKYNQPELYIGGKVCLSFLETLTDLFAQTLKSVLAFLLQMWYWGPFFKNVKFILFTYLVLLHHSTRNCNFGNCVLLQTGGIFQIWKNTEVELIEKIPWLSTYKYLFFLTVRRSFLWVFLSFYLLHHLSTINLFPVQKICMMQMHFFFFFQMSLIWPQWRKSFKLHS